jgi:carbon monoxide dehydrogenase subunit G
MELEHRFEVPVGIDRAWTSLLDMQQVAACFPGATLTSADGQEYAGSVKVKLGPIQLTYKGSARIVQADESAHRATIEASGSASRSSSTASMTVNATATELASDRTEVVMKTDLTITGRPAQFGRGVMVEVGNKILGQFADCLAAGLSAPLEEPGSGQGAEGGGDEAAGAEAGAGAAATSGAAGGDGDAGGDAGGGDAGGGGAGAGAAAGTRPADGPRHAAAYTRSPEPIDLLESAGTPVLKRLAPVLGGLVVLWLLRRISKRRKAKKAAKKAARALARSED